MIDRRLLACGTKDDLIATGWKTASELEVGDNIYGFALAYKEYDTYTANPRKLELSVSNNNVFKSFDVTVTLDYRFSKRNWVTGNNTQYSSPYPQKTGMLYISGDNIQPNLSSYMNASEDIYITYSTDYSSAERVAYKNSSSSYYKENVCYLQPSVGAGSSAKREIYPGTYTTFVFGEFKIRRLYNSNVYNPLFSPDYFTIYYNGGINQFGEDDIVMFLTENPVQE